MRPNNRRRNRSERYEIERSPFAQKPTQRDIAVLLGESRDNLRRLVNYKEQFIIRRPIKTGTGTKEKVRDLAYPNGRLRAVHERFKYHLDKIKQPNYLFSPRRERSQRDNAEIHLDQQQYLTLDLKQFYPSTTDDMVRKWLCQGLGMYEDVAGLLTHLSTIDGKVSFGSPLTPVLCSLVHRPMFDAIAEICDHKGLKYSVWVDDVTISGRFVPAEVLAKIRDVVRAAGMRSHDIVYRSGNRPVFITGIGVVGPKLVAPNALNFKIKECWHNYQNAVTSDEREFASQRLLSHLGTVRHISGPASEIGRKAADQMNAIRQQRAASQAALIKAQQSVRVNCASNVAEESRNVP